MASKKKVKRLKDIKSYEVAGVAKGANMRRYFVVKEDGAMALDLGKLSQLHTNLGKVISVMKSGTPAAETVEALNKDLSAIHADLSTLVGTAGAFDPAAVRLKIDEVKTAVAGLTESAGFDLNMADQLDGLLDKVKETEALLEAAPVQASPPAIEPAPVEQAQSPSAAAPAPAVAPATPPAAPSVQTADLAPATEPAPEPAVVTPPATEEAPAQTNESVTKSDLADFGKALAASIVAGFAEATKGITESVLKSATPGFIPPGAGVQPPAPPPANHSGEDRWAGLATLDINTMKDEDFQ